MKKITLLVTVLTVMAVLGFVKSASADMETFQRGLKEVIKILNKFNLISN